MTVIRYAGREYLLSGWNYTASKKLSQRSWLSAEGKESAVIITRRSNGYSYLVCSPDGELLDVGVCPTRGGCKKLAMRCLTEFTAHCRLHLRDISDGFRRWLS